MSITLKRVLAFIIDGIIISVIGAILLATPLDPNAERIQKLDSDFNLKYTEVLNSLSEVDESDSQEIESIYDEFMIDYKDYLKENVKLSVFENAVIVLVIIGYFVVLALSLKGETLGKKIMHLKVYNNDGTPVGGVGLLLRTIILFGIPFIVLDTVCAYVLNSNAFSYAHVILMMLSYGLNLAIIIMVFVRKDGRGLHDVLAKTKVEGR